MFFLRPRYSIAALSARLNRSGGFAMRWSSIAIVICSAAAGVVVAGQAPRPSAADRWWSHVEALANDGMEGRNTGSPGHKRAAEYVAAQFQKVGLEPAGDPAAKSYIQPVAFKTRRIVEARSSLALVRNGKTEPLALGEDANLSVRVDPAATIDAPLVFVGYGLHVPEQNMDDLQGLDLKGAVVVYITAVPRSLPGPLQAHFGSAAERWKAYRTAGAIGTFSIANPKSMDIPWSRATLARLQPSMSLADPALQDAPGQQFAASMNPAHADTLLAGSGHTFAELLELVDTGKPLPRFALPARVQATVGVERSEVVSQNVAGILRGSDPRRRSEYVVLSAHLDHLGVGEPINGDRIYNGAMDNASGVAAILEIAAELHEMNIRPARSLLFVAVTGEEKGELGSRYLAAHPTVPAGAIVANVNTDMFLPLFPLKTLMVLGLDESDLGADIRAVAKEAGVGVQADPEPQRNRFVRSDQYSFIKVGIPALAMKVGYEPGSPEAAIAAKWIAERYHAPSDDLNQPVDLSAGAKYVEIVRQLAVRIANRSDRPRWNETSFFKRFATGSTH
jgi:Zn-dependent M28 family amino/carboxypeptidase